MGLNSILGGLAVSELAPGIQNEWFPDGRRVGGVYDARSMMHYVEAWPPRDCDYVHVRWPGIDSDGGAFIYEFGVMDYLRQIGAAS